MEWESILLSEISQVVKKEIPYDFTYKWNLINKTISKQNITRDNEIKNKITVTREEGGEG